MARNKAPTISSIKHIEYERKQSKYGEHVPKLPMRSMIQSIPGRKDRTITEFDIRYRGFFNRIYIRSNKRQTT
jgi:hypothetical protein